MNGIPQYLPFVLVGAAGLVIFTILALVIGLIALKAALSIYVLRKGALPRRFRMGYSQIRNAWQPARTTRIVHYSNNRQNRRT